VQICFASHNKNKIVELRKLLGEEIDLIGLDDLGVSEEIPETGSTLEENALIKAEYVYSRFKIPCFADDTGLEVDALNGEPGVYSARYAGEPANSEKNINKLLVELEGVKNRNARFKTVIAYLDRAGERYFVGEVEGRITAGKSGDEGFGYDPVFLPKGFDSTFAEMTMEEKNTISHRGRAVRKLAKFLSNLK
jgi:XTP/dITP diphosphohydrolase